jgi:hypothetical protein
MLKSIMSCYSITLRRKKTVKKYAECKHFPQYGRRSHATRDGFWQAERVAVNILRTFHLETNKKQKEAHISITTNTQIHITPRKLGKKRQRKSRPVCTASTRSIHSTQQESST